MRSTSCFTVRGCQHRYFRKRLLLLHSLNFTPSVVVAVLFILLCTIAILHFILLRQQRRYYQSNPHTMVILRISHSESYVQEKINDHDDRDDNSVASISKYTSSPKESGCPFKFPHLHLSPSNIEKASDDDISNRMILSVCLTSSLL